MREIGRLRHTIPNAVPKFQFSACACSKCSNFGELRAPLSAKYDYRNPRCACAPRVNHSRRLIADWYFPDGTRLNFSSGFDDIYESRGTHRVDLRRRAMANTQTGIYCCIIPFNVSNPSERKMLYVGVYTDQEGIEAQYCDQ